MEQEPGIYCIRNIVTGDRYVGRAKNMEGRRRMHFDRLARGVHRNPLLQANFTTYGASNFVFEILEASEHPHLTAEEQAWIVKLRPTLNQEVPFMRLPTRPRRRSTRPTPHTEQLCPFRLLVKARMAEQGVTPVALTKLVKGKRIGGRDVPEGTLYSWIRGDSRINSSDLWIVLNALGIKVG